MCVLDLSLIVAILLAFVTGMIALKRVKNTIENKSEISFLKKEFKSHEYSIDKKEVWFSQFPLKDMRRATAYEMENGFYIPDSSKDALKLQIAIAIGNFRSHFIWHHYWTLSNTY